MARTGQVALIFSTIGATREALSILVLYHVLKSRGFESHLLFSNSTFTHIQLQSLTAYISLLIPTSSTPSTQQDSVCSFAMAGYGDDNTVGHPPTLFNESFRPS